MDDDIEINTRLQATKDIFLGGDDTSATHKNKTYTLEREFTRSQFNRNYTIVKVIIGLILLMLLISLSFHQYMRNQESNITIDVADFDEIKLKELLSTVINSNVELEMMNSELLEIENAYKTESTQLNIEFNRREKLALLNDDQAQIKHINTEREQANKELDDKFEAVSQTKKLQISDLESEIGRVKGDVDRVSGGDALALNPEQNLQQLRLSNLATYYENKISKMRAEFAKEKQAIIERYNPEFSEKSLTEILDNPVTAISDTDVISVMQEIESADQVNSATLIELQTTQQKQQELLQRLEKIPYINSPQSASAHLKSMTQSLNNRYNLTINELSQNLKQATSTLASYQYFVDKQLINEGEAGYVLDPRQSENIIVQLNSAYRVEAGDKALIFRQDDQLIAELEFYQHNDALKLKVVKRHDNEMLNPMDKVFLIKQRAEQ